MPKPQKQYSYLDNQKIDIDVKTLFDWASRLELVTTNPDGSRAGRFSGDTVYLQSGGNHYIEVYTGTGKVWKGVLLNDTP